MSQQVWSEYGSDVQVVDVAECAGRVRGCFCPDCVATLHAAALEEDAARWLAEGQRLLAIEVALMDPEWDEIGGSGVEPVQDSDDGLFTWAELVSERTAREYQALLRTWHWTAGAPRMLAAPHCYPV